MFLKAIATHACDPDVLHAAYVASPTPTPEQLQGSWQQTLSYLEPIDEWHLKKYDLKWHDEKSSCTIFPKDVAFAKGWKTPPRIIRFIKDASFGGMHVENYTAAELNCIMDPDCVPGSIHAVKFLEGAISFNAKYSSKPSSPEMHYCTLTSDNKLLCKVHEYKYEENKGEYAVHLYGMAIYEKVWGSEPK